MGPFLRKSLASAIIASAAVVSAQSSDDGVRVWAAVAYINHGDKTPSLGSDEEMLVPEGAQQLWRQGAAFRARYLNQTSRGDSGNSSVEEVAPIHGISTEALNNAQIDIAAAADEWVVAGALAFMQGLYPPIKGSVAELPGGEDMARNLAENDTDLVEYPLDGYQYPILRTLTAHDRDSPGVQGDVGCDLWQNTTGTSLQEDEGMQIIHNSAQDFFQNLFSSEPLAGSIDLDSANYWNAVEIYEWVKYMYSHNETVFDGLDNANETLTTLEEHALALSHTKLTAPDTANQQEEEKDGDDGAIWTVAGRSLGWRIADRLRSTINQGESREKMSLMFGSYKPMMSFLSIAGVLNRENLLSGPFTRFPKHGAAMIIELISDADQSSDLIPDAKDLRIRFYYRESADQDAQFENFSLFNSGLGGQSIPYTSFDREMTGQGLSSEEWCNACGATQAPFCPLSVSSDEDSGSGGMYGSDDKGMHQALAGLIGAAVLAAILGVAAVALYFLAGFRLRRVGPEGRSSMAGGFKGPEKKPSDRDVNITGSGDQQERIGSWELRGADASPPQAEFGANNGAGLVAKQPSRAATREVNRYKSDDDEVSLVGALPVAVRESI